MKVLYFLIGAPGSGKSTFLEKMSEKIYGSEELLRHVVSPDKVREIVACPEDKPDGSRGIDQKNEKFVWEFVRNSIEKKVDRGELIIIDATHSRTKAISSYKKFKEAGYRIIGIDFSKDLSIEEVLKRNRERDSVKFVPEDVVRSMHERCQTLEIPTWVKVIKPQEFYEHFTDNILDFSEFKTINIFGDIHGCPKELLNMLAACGIDPDTESNESQNQKTANVFVGDYFDRGYDVVETFKIMRNLQKNHWVLPLMGNHEEPLKYYTDFIKEISNDAKTWIHETIEPSVAQKEQLLKKSNILNRDIRQIQESTSIFGKIKNFFERIRYGDDLSPEKKITIQYKKTQIEVNDNIIKDIPDYEEEALKLMKIFKQSSYKQWDAFVEKLKKYPVAFEAFTNFVWSYKPPMYLVKDPEFGFNRIKRTSLGTIKKFALSDIKYTEIASFVKGCAQMFFVDFHGQKILVTHGGLVRAPDKTTPTSDMIRGVGGYEDAKLCMETFSKLHPDIIQVHGHRNMDKLPIQVTETTFNINGDIDLGLRSVSFHADKTIETTEILPSTETLEFFRRAQIEKAKRFNAKKLSPDEEGKGLLTLFQDHKHVDVKKLPDDIAAINFTKKAFDNGIWDSITIKARGLFVAIDKELQPDEIKVIARGYQKFFNVGERYGFKTRDIRELAYPILAYEKANGYLGLLSVDDRDPENPKWFISSKSSTTGDFALKFREMITPSLTEQLMEKMKREEVTLVFEVVEPEWDPHIEKYNEPELVILDAIKKDINFEKLPYERLPEFIEKMQPQTINVREKKLIKKCEGFNDYWGLVKEVNLQPLLSNNGIEGYVFEDASEIPHMFKLKTDWYSFWKYMRSLKIRISSRIRKNGERTGNYTLEKSASIALKQQLHREEEFKVFAFMVKLAEEDFEAFQKLGIIDIREKFLEDLEKSDENSKI